MSQSVDLNITLISTIPYIDNITISGDPSFFFSIETHPAEKFGEWAAKMCVI